MRGDQGRPISGSKDVSLEASQSMEVQRAASLGQQVKRNDVEDDIEMDDDEAKERRVMCLKLAWSDFEKSSRGVQTGRGHARNDGQRRGPRQAGHVCRAWKDIMLYFVHLNSSHITTSSVQPITRFRFRGSNDEGETHGHGVSRCGMKSCRSCTRHRRGIVKACHMQVESDDRPFVPCGPGSGDVQTELEQAVQEKRQCQGRVQEPVDEAWDDANDGRLNPATARATRHVGMEYSHKVHVYEQVPIQECKDIMGSISR